MRLKQPTGNEAFEIVKSENRHVSDTGILRGHCADTYILDGVNFH